MILNSRLILYKFNRIVAKNTSAGIVSVQAREMI